MSEPRYSMPSRLIHWVMALLILLTIPAGMVMVQPGLDRGLQNTLFIFHKNIGVALLALVVLRAAWRLGHPAPPLPATVPGWQARIAGLSHMALYALMVTLPVAGYVRVKAGGFPIETLDALGIPSLVPRSDALAEVAKTIHYGAGLAIVAVLAAHIGAALFHGIVKRDGVFSRIWPPVGGKGR
ncbi:cytochrome b [Roseicyclus mahoneyensis]|uniref:Cytochrome b561 n=1 Tax=Roseicyclus mahoneyensis TaxID=164332 RepID=A0A316GRB0_9RHOB|nr:cytochrome b [Roseicyclus mahoneyensis]PWK62941.1 cytochrome b561 [Roseicyclus mahoneyensis]